MHTECGVQSDRGKIRTSNEDCYVASNKNMLFLVADGMGGHAAGEIASQIAASTVEEVISKGADPEAEPEDVLRFAVEEANSRIYQAQCQRAEYEGMGSTLTVLAFRDNHYYIAHVGDSRAYLFRDGILDQLTQDHSLVWQLYESGILSKAELSHHPQKNLITRSIGPHIQVEVDLEGGPAYEGDVFLLCSDGLTDVLTDDDIRRVLSDNSKTPQELSEFLVNAANAGGGPDNVTAVVVRPTPEK